MQASNFDVCIRLSLSLFLPPSLFVRHYFFSSSFFSTSYSALLRHSSRSRHFQTRSLRGRELFNCDLQQWHSAEFFFSFSCFIYVFVRLSKVTYAENSQIFFCLVDIKKRSFLTSCVFWFLYSNQFFFTTLRLIKKFNRSPLKNERCFS